LQRNAKFKNIEDSVKKTHSKINLGLFNLKSSNAAANEEKKSSENTFRLREEV
jgi:hypothetical protein